MERPEDWLTNANDAININLVRVGDGNVWTEPCHPSFTYPIFGEEETIFGYKALKIFLDFQAHDLQPSLRMQFDEKWKPMGNVQATDVQSSLTAYLPDRAPIGHRQDDGGAEAKASKGTWKPPGALVRNYTVDGRSFEVWCASLADQKARDILKAMQILIPFFIEGGTCQDLNDQPWTLERWKIFILYQTVSSKDKLRTSPYTFVGFSTSYRLWVFPAQHSQVDSVDPTPSEAGHLPIPSVLSANEDSNPFSSPHAGSHAGHDRERISQFLILPPYQGQSHGTQLYDTMMRHFLSDPNVFEVTVEDPNEAFDDLRDWGDLDRLRQLERFVTINLTDQVPPEALTATAPFPKDLLLPLEDAERIRQQNKIVPRQFWRMLEMHLLSQIPPLNRNTARITRKAASSDANDRRYYFWRLLVKERLYRHNLDQLAQLDHRERIEKLEETLDGLQQDYERLLARAERRLYNVRAQPHEATKQAVSERRRRRLVQDDEDLGFEKSGDGNSVKRAKAI